MTDHAVAATTNAPAKLSRPSLTAPKAPKPSKAPPVKASLGGKKKSEGSSKAEENTEKPKIKSAYQLFCDSMRAEVKGKDMHGMFGFSHVESSTLIAFASLIFIS
jgi:hypothetical protein